MPDPKLPKKKYLAHGDDPKSYTGAEETDPEKHTAGIIDPNKSKDKEPAKSTAMPRAYYTADSKGNPEKYYIRNDNGEGKEISRLDYMAHKYHTKESSDIRPSAQELETIKKEYMPSGSTAVRKGKVPIKADKPAMSTPAVSPAKKGPVLPKKSDSAQD
jgi:hypothetical protein